MIKAPTLQIPGIYHRRIGEIFGTAVSDGDLHGQMGVTQNIILDGARGVLPEEPRAHRARDHAR